MRTKTEQLLRWRMFSCVHMLYYDIIPINDSSPLSDNSQVIKFCLAGSLRQDSFRIDILLVDEHIYCHFLHWYREYRGTNHLELATNCS